ncbi:MAG: hypothetical protein IPK44_25515 [Candidatus Accumulibacter sp.]|nr:hypothetical protein [Accumulibacter sp.]
MISLAIPLADQVLIGEVAIDRLSEFLGSLPTEAGMWTMILDRRGRWLRTRKPVLTARRPTLGLCRSPPMRCRGTLQRMTSQ